MLDPVVNLCARPAARQHPAAVKHSQVLRHVGLGGVDLRQQLDSEREHFVRNLFDANGGEGLQAFAEKRPPAFR